ncbi:hypothetical protein P3X46_034928 [Hevea brasiliensis]|uniref:Cytochrome b5 heme-binding domain-containing protein n=1 Tax=Hevea brasiliensis TaxID=3981 RepID=A0ABQ9K749_HEVBR|nr:cytochrome B5-like protein [Hevea brasiliensis]KAJ9128514.1 hypothetical protein P3X46_034928 [Hevea brasiliensis]
MVVAVVALILGVLLGGFILIPRHLKSAQRQKGHSTTSEKKASKVYSKAEVSLHNKRTNCWIIIKEKVYDVTSYVEEHPGGDAILAHAGDDSTEGFYGPQHATRVFDMIEDFYIGDLEQ